MSTRQLFSAIALMLMLAASAVAGTPSQITVQGRLTDLAGVPLPPGAKSFTFRLFNASVGGSQIWPVGGGEVQSITSGADGLWIGLLGAVDPLNDAVFIDSVRWLEIDVNGTTLPRIRLVTGPYAYRVATVDGASGGTITSKVSIGPGHSNNGADGFVAGNGNQLGGDYSAIGGGSLNTTATGSATISGGQQNNASGFASSIAGGASNTASNTYSSVGGGLSNSAMGSWARVGGGMINSANNEGAVVGGGRYNNARGQYSTVAGGGGQNVADSNTATGDYSHIGGGARNVASGFASGVNGGRFNLATGDYSTVGGGQFSFARGAWSTVAGGGGQSFFGDTNSARGLGCTVGGGMGNTADYMLSTVAGGRYNRAYGDFATVSGGLQCQAAGPYSTVGGGYLNGAGENGTVGGGYQNAADLEATVSGGRDNYAYAFGTIAGGHGNRAGYAATVSGGYFNKATGEHSTISGGGGYNAVDSNSAAGGYSFVGGGSRNSSSGPGAVIVGGDSNRSNGQNSAVGGGGFNAAEGTHSTVPGGHVNAARGNFSFAAGSYARANHFGSFVWSDRSPADPSVDTFYSTASNQFLIRAAGGVGIGTTSPQQALSIAGGINIDQANVNAGGLLTNGLSFGSVSGEGVASRRTAGANQYGLDFFTNWTPRMSITNGGYVGIGLTNPAFRIELPNIGNTDGQGRANAWTTYSSRRWKDNIRTISDAIAKVEKLRGVEYDNKSDGSHSIGLIAEEVGEVIPEVVAYERNGTDAQSLDYARLVALLIEGMKEQQRQIDELRQALQLSKK